MDFVQLFSNNGVQRLLVEITTAPILKKIEDIENSLKHTNDTSYFVYNFTMALQNNNIQDLMKEILLKDILTSPIFEMVSQHQTLTDILDEMSNLRKEIKSLNRTTKCDQMHTGNVVDVGDECHSSTSLTNDTVTDHNPSTCQTITEVKEISLDQYASIQSPVHLYANLCDTTLQYIKEEVSMPDVVDHRTNETCITATSLVPLSVSDPLEVNDDSMHGGNVIEICPSAGINSSVENTRISNNQRTLPGVFADKDTNNYGNIENHVDHSNLGDICETAYDIALTPVSFEYQQIMPYLTLLPTATSHNLDTNELSECSVKLVKMNIETAKKDMSSNSSADQTHQCKVCGKVYSTTNNLNKHFLLHGPKQFYCSYCSKGFVHRWSLTVHMKSCSKTKNCKSNSKFLKSKHLQDYKGTSTNYKCDLCGKCYHRKSTLQWHVTTVHARKDTDEKNNSVYVKSKPKHHIQCNNTNNGLLAESKPVQVKKKKLKDKPKKSCNDKVQQCLVCRKVYQTKESLKKHSFVHGPKRFRCLCCNKAFVYKWTYTVPMRSKDHKDNSKASKSKYVEDNKNSSTQYKCNKCGKCYHRQSTLHCHMTTVHAYTNPDKENIDVDGKTATHCMQSQQHAVPDNSHGSSKCHDNKKSNVMNNNPLSEIKLAHGNVNNKYFNITDKQGNIQCKTQHGNEKLVPEDADSFTNKYDPMKDSLYVMPVSAGMEQNKVSTCGICTVCYKKY